VGTWYVSGRKITIKIRDKITGISIILHEIITKARKGIEKNKYSIKYNKYNF
jgi:hypothetical protein